MTDEDGETVESDVFFRALLKQLLLQVDERTYVIALSDALDEVENDKEVVNELSEALKVVNGGSDE